MYKCTKVTTQTKGKAIKLLKEPNSLNKYQSCQEKKRAALLYSQPKEEAHVC